jgi:UDPglucose 6-dehydrogenase
VRIGTHFLYAGCGYGGSCFPKDVKALIKTASGAGQELLVLKAVEAANDRQKTVLVGKVVKRFGPDLKGKHFALWGLAFKPNTDDMSEATSRVVIEELFARGATITAYDPVAMEEARRIFGDDARLTYAPNPNEALDGADALIIVTEWKEFRSPDFARIKSSLKSAVIFDGRNLYEPELVKQAGLTYDSIGRQTN